MLLFAPVPGSFADSGNAPPQGHPVQVTMRNVMYHYSDPIAAHLIYVEGYLTPASGHSIVVFDDTNSFILHLASAEIAISCDALAEVLNKNVFAADNAPFKNLHIENRNNQLDIKGNLHQKGDVPFEATGTLSVDEKGTIRLHADHVKAVHLP
jgi:hypothetical protein